MVADSLWTSCSSLLISLNILWYWLLPFEIWNTRGGGHRFKGWTVGRSRLGAGRFAAVMFTAVINLCSEVVSPRQPGCTEASSSLSWGPSLSGRESTGRGRKSLTCKHREGRRRRGTVSRTCASDPTGASVVPVQLGLKVFLHFPNRFSEQK